MSSVSKMLSSFDLQTKPKVYNSWSWVLADEQYTLHFNGGTNESGKETIQEDQVLFVLRRDSVFNIVHTSQDNPFVLQQAHLQYSADAPISEGFLDRYLVSSPLPRHLLLPPDHFHIVVSTKSGTEQAEKYFEDLLHPALKLLGLPFEKFRSIKTESQGSIRILTKEVLKVRAEEGIQQSLLLLSGDGGVADIINNILEEGEKNNTYTRPVVAIFPLGTGNALFHSLNRSAPQSRPLTTPPLTLALRNLVHGAAKPLPIFRATFSNAVLLTTNEAGALQLSQPLPQKSVYGAVVASYGFHATLVADSDTPSWRRHGSARFGLVAKSLLESPHAYHATVTLQKQDGSSEVIGRTEHGYVLVTLVSNLESNFTISPASRPLDGILRVVHFGALSGDQVMAIMGDAYQNGAHVDVATGKGKGDVGYEAVKALRVDFGEEGDDGHWRRVCVDGLIVKVEEGGWMEIKLVDTGEEAVDVLV